VLDGIEYRVNFGCIISRRKIVRDRQRRHLHAGVHRGALRQFRQSLQGLALVAHVIDIQFDH
jgi:hypothetical protein